MCAIQNDAFVRQFVHWVEGRSFGFKPKAKTRLHQEAKRVLRILARQLGLKSGEYEILSNQGGIAVAGEITLHSDTLYVQIRTFLHPGVRILFRRCYNRKDYVGEKNHFSPIHALLDIPVFCQSLQLLTEY